MGVRRWRLRVTLCAYSLVGHVWDTTTTVHTIRAHSEGEAIRTLASLVRASGAWQTYTGPEWAAPQMSIAPVLGVVRANIHHPPARQ